MKKFLEKVPYLIFSFFLFIILPLCSYFISNRSGMIIWLLLFLYPIVNFIISFLYAYNKEDFSYIFSFIIGIFYIISCLIILNFDILIYGLGYIFFSLCGQGTGFLIGKLHRSKKRAKQSQLNLLKEKKCLLITHFFSFNYYFQSKLNYQTITYISYPNSIPPSSP